MPYPNVKLQTDQSGANQNVCFGIGRVFNFSVTFQSNLISVDLVLKKGSGTIDSISASLYNGSNGSGDLVSFYSVDASDITQSYSSIIFPFTDIILYPDISYSLVLSSSSSCDGNNPYSMKSGNFQVLNSDTGLLLNTGYGISSNILSVNTLSANLNVVPPTPTPTTTSTLTPTPTNTLTSTPTTTLTLTASPSATPSYTLTLTSTPTTTPTISSSPTITPTPSNTSNISKQPNMGIKHVKFKLGNKNPKIYKGSSLIYNPNNN